MISLFELATRSFGHFVACTVILYILLYFPCNMILQIIHKLIRARTIRIAGYPPAHCDGDGDFYYDDKDEIESNVDPI